MKENKGLILKNRRDRNKKLRAEIKLNRVEFTVNRKDKLDVHQKWESEGSRLSENQNQG